MFYLPGVKGTQYKISGHADVMPTIFDYLGLNLPISAFAGGKSLITYEEQNDVAFLQQCKVRQPPEKFLVAYEDHKYEFLIENGALTLAEITGIDDAGISLEEQALLEEETAIVRTLVAEKWHQFRN